MLNFDSFQKQSANKYPSDPRRENEQTEAHLGNLQHLRVEPVQMKDEFCKTNEGQLDGEHLPEGPVVRGVGESVQSPFLEHAARHHVTLHLLQDVSENLHSKRVRWEKAYLLLIAVSCFWEKFKKKKIKIYQNI